MANANTPFGLKPYRGADSEPHNGGLEMFYHAAADGVALYIGDPVVKAGSADAAGVASVVRAAVGGPITGVVQGFVPDGTTDAAGYGAASTAYYVLVATNPDDLYVIQDNTGLAAADIGLNADMTTGSGNAYTKRSGFTLNAASKAATATLALKIVGLAPVPNNDFGAYNKVLVKLNASTEISGAAGV